ncbi:MAG: CBASS cGAMP-activated phospholipase [Sulfuricaulis sp.]
MTKKMRILTIDGGGIKGVLPAAFLAQIEKQTGKRIVDHFDLIAGTSTGGVIAIGLGMGMSASEILDLYEKKGASIFYQDYDSVFGRLQMLAMKFLRSAKRVVAPKYSSERLREALEQVFGERILGQSTTRLLIPAYHAVQRDLYVFKTAHHPRFQTDWRERAVDVALATAAAPTYLSSHRLPNGCDLIDGGVWANNPVGTAVVEAIGVLRWNLDDTRVVSLGCTEDTFTLSARAGIKDVAHKTADLFLQGQSKSSIGTAKILLGDSPINPKLFRYTHTVKPGFFDLDKVSMIHELRGLGSAMARNALPTLNQIFLNDVADKFVPFHGPGSSNQGTKGSV